MTERNLSIRLSVKDQDTVKRALEALGKDGQAALQRIDEGSKPASRGLLAVNAASQETQAGMAALAGRAGPVGNVLSAIGPAGSVAAVGIGAFVVGMTAAIQRSGEAAARFADVIKTSERLGVTTKALQELRFAAEKVGIGSESADEALKELGIRAAEAADGTGEGAEGFKKLGISQDELKGKLKDLPGLFELVASRIAQMKTSAEQAYIADKIFGDQGGEKLVALLKQGSEGLARFRQEAATLGVVVEDSMLRRGAEANRQLQTMHMVISANLDQALIDLAPILVGVAEGFATVARWVAEVVDGFREIENRSTHGLRSRLEEVDTDLSRLQGMKPGSGIAAANLQKQIADLKAEKAQLEKELNARASPVSTPVSPTPWGGKPADDYIDPNADPVKDAKAQFKRAVQSFEFESDQWDQERATRDSLDQTARELMEYAIKLREPQRKMLEDQAKDVQRIMEANTKARVDAITRVGDAIDRSLQDNLSKSAAGFQSWGDSVRAIIMDVANELIRMYMIQTTGGGIGSWIAQGINTWVGSMGGGTTPGKVMSGNTSGAGYFGARDYGGLTTAGGPRASGGQVFPGSVYLVNERRAEDSTTPGFFMPVRPGVIHPESQGSNGGGVGLTQQFNLSVSGGTAAEIQQLRAMVDDMAANFGARTVAALAQARRTGALRNIGM